MYRRTVIGGVVGATATLVGCTDLRQDLGATGKHQHASDPWESRSQSQTAAGYELDAQVVLPQGTYAIQTYGPDVAFRFSLEGTVERGGPIDVWVMEDDEFDRYREREDALYLSSVSRSEVRRFDISGQLNAGDYVICFDNSAFNGAQPEGEAQVSFTMAVSVV